MGQPSSRVNLGELLTEFIGEVERTQGSETSQYLQEKKSNRDSLSSGERTGKSPNQASRDVWGCRASAIGPGPRVERLGTVGHRR